jgi:hypothetical protein
MADKATNGFDPKTAKQFLGDINRLEAEMESKKGEYMAWCKRQRELINGIYDRAKDSGIPKRPLKAYVKRAVLLKRADAIVDVLEEDDQDLFEQLEEALGDYKDTPLGQAAMKAAGDEDEEDLRPRHLRQREKDRQAERDEALDGAVTH